MLTRHCSSCDSDKTEEHFSPSVWKRTKGRAWCRVCAAAYYAAKQEDGFRRQSKYQRTWRRKSVDRVRELRADKGCADCGEKHPACLDFHHIDEAGKQHTIAQLALRASPKTIDREIAKCVVLCANCHRKRHFNEKSGHYGRAKEA